MNQRDLVPLDSIAAGQAVVEKKVRPDDKDALELSLSHRRTRAEINVIEQSNHDKRVNRKLRYKYALAVYRYLAFYSGGCAVVLLLSGFRLFGFALPDAVLTALVGSTALAAIGLVGFVVSGLFKPVA